MKAGIMLVILNTKRQEVKTGEIVPILDGTFTFRNFVVVDTPFLTRLVSFVSLPGLTNLITNNKDVIFKVMNGKFDYGKDIINITESAAEGPFFDFTLTGKINTLQHKIDIGGNVIPSMYGLSTLLKSIPVLGKVCRNKPTIWTFRWVYTRIRNETSEHGINQLTSVAVLFKLIVQLFQGIKRVGAPAPL